MSQREQDLLALILSADFEGVDSLRQQKAAIVGVEPSCGCGCPSINLIVNREAPPAPVAYSRIPVELQERNRSGGTAPRDVLCFLRDGYLDDLECVYYDDAVSEWPDPDDCATVFSAEAPGKSD